MIFSAFNTNSELQTSMSTSKQLKLRLCNFIIDEVIVGASLLLDISPSYALKNSPTTSTAELIRA